MWDIHTRQGSSMGQGSSRKEPPADSIQKLSEIALDHHGILDLFAACTPSSRKVLKQYKAFWKDS